MLPSNEYPDGFCTLDCDTSSDCPSNSECIDRDGGVCLFSCFDDATCAFLGLGWRCQEDGLHAFPDSKVKICRGG
ncbi:MAG TPA: hypothetical protein VFQ53_21930 [Kofleriaceae bacterium]|nr:hypothetical protein [Kofleriaceae bacterium]